MADIANTAQNLGKQVGGEALGQAAGEAAQLAKWLAEPLNQWKLNLIASIVGIPIVILLADVQFFLVKLVGLKIPKILPDMPWWEILILVGLGNLLLALAILLLLYPLIAIMAIGCLAEDLPVLGPIITALAGFAC